MKELVEKIIEYTKIYSLTETEWYWNIECARKPSNINDKEISWKEFEVAIREEILYDLVYNEGAGLLNQMENDMCNYSSEFDGEETYKRFINDSKNLENEVRKVVKNFVVERYDENGNKI